MPQVYKGTLKKPRTIGEKITQAFVDFVEEVNARFSVHGNPPVYDVNLFPWPKKLGENYPLISKELDTVLAYKDDLPAFHEITPEVTTITQD